MHNLKSLFPLTKGTKTVMVVMFFLAFSALLLAWLYYEKLTKTEDPRVAKALIKYEEYNKTVETNTIEESFNLLDTIKLIYTSYEDYKNSYEMGLLLNNEAALWLKEAFSENIDSVKTQYLENAKLATFKAIGILNNWQGEYENLAKSEISLKISAFYEDDNPIFNNYNIVDIITKRTKDIVIAQNEIHKWLSVAYTNLGTIARHMGDNRNSMLYNKKALELWPGNLTARQTLNVIMGQRQLSE